MNGITRPSGSRWHAFLGAIVLLAVTTSSVAAADGGPGPLGVTTRMGVTPASSRIGALFGAEGAQEGGHFCTASVVHSKRGDLVVTAAHCLGKGTMWFAPGYRNGKAPYGVWKVTGTYVGDAWSGGQDEDSDVAFATLESIGGVDIEHMVGANKFVAGRETGSTAVTVTGYPNSRETPVTCTNKPTARSRTHRRGPRARRKRSRSGPDIETRSGPDRRRRPGRNDSRAHAGAVRRAMPPGRAQCIDHAASQDGHHQRPLDGAVPAAGRG